MKSANRRTGCGGGGVLGYVDTERSVGGVLKAVAGAAPAVAFAAAPKPTTPPKPTAKRDRPGGADVDAGAVAGVTRTSAPPAGDESDGVPFLLLLLVIAGLATVLAAVLRLAPVVVAAIPAARAKAPEVQCDFCRSTKVAVNPVQAVYRCATCGFNGVLPAQVAAELGNMHTPPHDVDHSTTARRGT